MNKHYTVSIKYLMIGSFTAYVLEPSNIQDQDLPSIFRRISPYRREMSRPSLSKRCSRIRYCHELFSGTGTGYDIPAEFLKGSEDVQSVKTPRLIE